MHFYKPVFLIEHFTARTPAKKKKKKKPSTRNSNPTPKLEDVLLQDHTQKPRGEGRFPGASARVQVCSLGTPVVRNSMVLCTLIFGDDPLRRGKATGTQAPDRNLP